MKSPGTESIRPGPFAMKADLLRLHAGSGGADDNNRRPDRNANAESKEDHKRSYLKSTLNVVGKQERLGALAQEGYKSVPNR